MINNHYQLYVDNALNLAETIVIKFEAAAEAMNQAVISQKGYAAVDNETKTSWKYYQNISGRYHFTDTMIQINSLDLAEKIDFTTANLAEHTATRQAYEYGSRYYRDLLQQHPDQELLILGILYPCDIDQAVAAQDGTILTYPAKYVEESEYTFIFKLQDWVYKYLDRWVNKQYSLSDDLYAATYIGQLYLHLVQAIFTIRLEACKTNEAHSFHIQQYLASHGMLDKYLTAMTRDQALFFYRNILYIQRNAGKRDTFDWLVDKVMTQRNLPLYAYSMSHDLSTMHRSSLTDDATLQPVVTFKRKPLNVPAQQADKTAYGLQQVFDKVRPLAKGNAQYESDFGPAMNEQLTDSLSSVKATKMLESSVIDYADAVPYTRESILFNHWLYLAATEKLTATSFVGIPKNGSSVRLPAQDAVALFFYSMNRALQTESLADDKLLAQRLPLIHTQRVVRSPVPLLSELQAVVDPAYVGAGALAAIYETRVQLPTLPSTEAFYAKCQEIYDAAALQYVLYTSQENQIARGQAQVAVSKLYSDETVTLSLLRDDADPSVSMTYGAWLEKTGLTFEGYSRQDFYDISVALVSTATGADNHAGFSLGAMQQAMVSLFSALSSYSVQVVSETNASSIIVVPHPQLRVGDVKRQESFHDFIDTAPVRVRSSKVNTSSHYFSDLNKLYPLSAPRFSEGWRAKTLLPVRGRLSAQDIASVWAHLPNGLQGFTSFDFAAATSALSLTARKNLVDMYCDCPLGGVFSDESRLNAFVLVSHTKAINAFHFRGDSIQPVYPARPQLAYLNAFTLLSHAQGINAFNFRGTSLYPDLAKPAQEEQLNAFSLLSHVKAINAFHFRGASHLSSFAREAVQETLDGFTYVGNDVDLDAFTYAGGLFVQNFE